jgi:hypothetical protein
LAIEESAIARLVDASEKRAALRCPTFDENNVYWKRSNDLLEEQESIMKRMKQFNTQTMVKTNDVIPHVSEFMNEPSPIKENHRKRCALEAKLNYSNEDSDSTSDEVTLSFKKGKVSEDK